MSGYKKDTSGQVVCGGKTLCYYCQTPIHGCVSHHNERGEVSYFEEDGTETKLVARYHSWCGVIAKMQRVDNCEHNMDNVELLLKEYPELKLRKCDIEY